MASTHFYLQKGFKGHTGCRLDKPSGLSDSTKPTLLKPVEIKNEHNDTIGIDVETANVPTLTVANLQDHNQNPTQTLDDPLIAWELKRPHLHSDFHLNTNIQNDNILLKKHQKINDIIQKIDLVATDTDENHPLQMMKKATKKNLTNLNPSKVDDIHNNLNQQLKDGNGPVVEHNDILSFCTGSYNASIILGQKH